MSEVDFEHFCRVVRERSGLVLSQDKAYLVQSRLAPIARSEGLGGPADLLAKLRTGGSRELVGRCVDAMATHESSFFRDGTPFQVLAEKVLPDMLAARAGDKRLDIWCAACSSGQEPYSLAMVLQEMGGRLAGWRVRILATDMSEGILAKARSGLYSDFEVRRGLTPERLSRWFTRSGSEWKVAPILQQMIEFRPHNLLEGTAGIGRLDLIFCRNVLIYFDLEGKRRILADLRRALAPDGALALGSAETILGVSDAFELLPGARGLYRPQQTKMASSA